MSSRKSLPSNLQRLTAEELRSIDGGYTNTYGNNPNTIGRFWSSIWGIGSQELTSPVRSFRR